MREPLRFSSTSISGLKGGIPESAELSRCTMISIVLVDMAATVVAHAFMGTASCDGGAQGALKGDQKSVSRGVLSGSVAQTEHKRVKTNTTSQTRTREVEIQIGGRRRRGGIKGGRERCRRMRGLRWGGWIFCGGGLGSLEASRNPELATFWWLGGPGDSEKSKSRDNQVLDHVWLAFPFNQ
jgi:hypothetical protein